jgi:hypothetical protein
MLSFDIDGNALSHPLLAKVVLQCHATIIARVYRSAEDESVNALRAVLECIVTVILLASCPGIVESASLTVGYNSFPHSSQSTHPQKSLPPLCSSAT